MERSGWLVYITLRGWVVFVFKLAIGKNIDMSYIIHILLTYDFQEISDLIYGQGKV